jgi:hypothetical protein
VREEPPRDRNGNIAPNYFTRREEIAATEEELAILATMWPGTIQSSPKDGRIYFAPSRSPVHQNAIAQVRSSPPAVRLVEDFSRAPSPRLANLYRLLRLQSTAGARLDPPVAPNETLTLAKPRSVPRRRHASSCGTSDD